MNHYDNYDNGGHQIGHGWHVVRRARGLQGQWFDYGIAARFVVTDGGMEAARVYAEEFARELGEGGSRGSRVVVREWWGDKVTTQIVAAFKSDDYLRK